MTPCLISGRPQRRTQRLSHNPRRLSNGSSRSANNPTFAGWSRPGVRRPEPPIRGDAGRPGGKRAFRSRACHQLRPPPLSTSTQHLCLCSSATARLLALPPSSSPSKGESESGGDHKLDERAGIRTSYVLPRSRRPLPSSPRRPAHDPPAQNMYVDMENRLAGPPARVDDEAISVTDKVLLPEDGGNGPAQFH
jgi:hypothetical protein